MLVLTRKQQEQIRIGENITLTILKVKGKSIRIGIDAPKDVRVVRGELNDIAEATVATKDLMPQLSESVGTRLDINEKLNQMDKNQPTKVDPPKASQSMMTSSAPQASSDYEVLSFRLPGQEQVTETPGLSENRIKTMQDFMAKR
ncbi:MAG: carbon storage regulator [Pirellulales bacterium]